MTHSNFCKPGMMSTCTAGIKYDDHKKCFFAERSSDHSRCMHFLEVIDGACDCAAAQRAEYNPVALPETEILPMTMPIVKRPMEGIIANPKPIDITKAQVRKVCPIDFSTICSKSFCNQWNWCKDPFKNK